MIAWAAALSLLAGCAAPQPSRGWHGREPVMASYSGGVLYSQVPPGVPVQSVIAAGEQALERRGYVITAVSATDDRGRVVARPGDPKLLRKISVEARLISSGTALSVRVNPGGNEHISRDVLERMLTLLGL